MEADKFIIKQLKQFYKNNGNKVVSLIDLFREKEGILKNYDGVEDDFYIKDAEGKLWLPYTINDTYLTVRQINKNSFSGKVSEGETQKIQYIDCSLEILSKFLSFYCQLVLTVNKMRKDENERIQKLIDK